jgi:alpha-galactosidase
MIPALVEIAADVGRLCPKAFFANYSNPLTTNCRAMRKATGVPVVGLCHGVMAIEQYLADFAGILRGEATSLAVGVNHLTFFLELRWKGRDAWPLVRARLAEERKEPVDTSSLGQLFPEMGAQPEGAPRAADNPFSWSFFETYGVYPAVNDRHVIEFFPERFSDGQYCGKTIGVDIFSVEKTIEHGDRSYAEMKAVATGQREVPGWLFNRAPGEHEQLLDIVGSMVRDECRVFSMNLPNHGAVPGLPDDAVLEMPAVAAARGPCALQMEDFPSPLAAILSRVIAAQELTVEAALTGDRRLFVEAMLADGSVTDPQVASRLAEELLEAHKSNLPQF